MPDIDEIATFIRVMRHGTLAGAARELGLPKSTVSRRIARLEERLGAELLHRRARKVQVTREGKRLYDRVAGAVDHIELAVRGTLQDAELPRGVIRLTAPADFGRLLLVDALVSFAKAYPEISVELELTDRFVDLAQEGFDLAVRAGPGLHSQSDPSLIMRGLMRSDLHLAASPTFAPRVSRPDDLESVPFVLFRSQGLRDTLRLQSKSGRLRELTVEGQFVVSDYSAMAELVARGVGVGLMPAMHIDKTTPRGCLRRLLPDLWAEGGQIALVYPTRRLPERVRLLIDHLTRQLALSVVRVDTAKQQYQPANEQVNRPGIPGDL